MALLFCVALAAACGGTEVNCLSPVIQIGTNGLLVKSLSLSGPGCENSTLTSCHPSPEAPVSVRCDTGFTPYCRYYYIDPGASGECTVHIVLESGVVVDKTASFSYTSNGGPCSGYHAQGDPRWLLTYLVADGGA